MKIEKALEILEKIEEYFGISKSSERKTLEYAMNKYKKIEDFRFWKSFVIPLIFKHWNYKPDINKRNNFDFWCKVKDIELPNYFWKECFKFYLSKNNS